MPTLAEFRETIDWYDGKIAKEEEEDRKKELKKQRTKVEKQLEAAIVALVKNDVEQKYDTGNGPAAQRERYTHIKRIETALGNIPQFEGNDPAETESFLDRLEQAHKILVTDVDPTLEPDFVTTAKLRLGPSVYKHLSNAGDVLKTMDDVTKFIRTHYSAKINAVQSFSKVFDIDFDARLPYCTYATEVTNVLKVAFTQLEKQYREFQKNDAAEVPTDVLVQFFGALVMANKVQLHAPDTYRDMIRDLDTCLTAQQVANKATFYRHRLQQEGTTTAFFGRGNGKPEVERNDGAHMRNEQRHDTPRNGNGNAQRNQGWNNNNHGGRNNGHRDRNDRWHEGHKFQKKLDNRHQQTSDAEGLNTHQQTSLDGGAGDGARDSSKTYTAEDHEYVSFFTSA